MNTVEKIFFCTCTIALGFVSPVISFGLIILYYLPVIIQDLCKPSESNQKSSKMNSFSEDVLEDMK